MKKIKKSNVEKFMPGLVMLGSYKTGWLKYDFMAGLSVAAVAIPIAIAYSQLAGVPPVYGLYASILPLVAYALFGTSRQLIMAPDAATCAIVAAVVLPLAGSDMMRYISLTMTLSVITGIFCIAAGFARLGFLTNFLARPILSGYLNGIAISIITGQLGKLFGFTVKPGGFIRSMVEFCSKISETHVITLSVGVVSFIILRMLKHFVPKIPAPLIAVALGIGASVYFRLNESGVVILGEIPAGLPGLMVPDVAMTDFDSIMFGAVGLTLISFNSAMVTARGFAVKNRYDIDPNREFIALGVADIGAGMLQGFAVSGADSRTAVNDSAGGKSQVTGLIASGFIVVTLLFLTGPLAALPIAVLSAVLVNSAIGLFDIDGLRKLRKISPREFRLSLITLLGVITVGVLPGVAVAIGVALVQLIAKVSNPNDALLGRIPGIDGYHNIAGQPEAETIHGLILFRFDSALVFFNSDHFKSRIRSVSAEAKCLILDAGGIPEMDSTGAAALGEVFAELADHGITVAVAGAKGSLRDMLEKTGLMDQIGRDRFFPTMDSAVTVMKQMVK